MQTNSKRMLPAHLQIIVDKINKIEESKKRKGFQIKEIDCEEIFKEKN